MLLDRNDNGLVYRDILRDTLVYFARLHVGENFRYENDNASPHRSRVVTDYMQQEDITKMDQPVQSPDCNHIEHLWDESGCTIDNMDHPTHNLNELRQALLDQWTNIPVERPCGHYLS